MFQPAGCPTPALGGDSGFDLLFGYQEAHDIAAVGAQPFLAGLSLWAGGVVIVLLAVAAALEIPAMTVDLLISLSTFCTSANADGENEVVNANMVNLDNTSIAMLALDNQVQTLEGQVKQLLDTRTQTIITKLNGAQASLNAAQQQAIEQALAGGHNAAIASYELPGSLGGYLDTTPIGVQAIVTNALATVQQSGQKVDPDAFKKLNDANNALAAGQYKQAFFTYQDAYQHLTHN